MKKLGKASMTAVTLAASVGMIAPWTLSSTAFAASNNTLTIGQGTAFNDEFIPDLDGSLYTANITGFSFDTLLSVNSKLQFIPWLAKSWSWSKDKKTLTMHLQPKANWSDGKPITSQDVLFFMNYLASKTYNTTLQGQYEYLVDPVKGAQEIVKGKKTSFTQTGGFKIINNKTFQITFNTVDAAVLYADVSSYQPLPAHILSKIPMKDWPTAQFDKQPNVVSGPYIFQKTTGTDSVQMTANPHYWAGKAKIQNVVFKTAEDNVAPGLLANGNIQLQMNGLKPQDIPDLKSMPGLKVVTMPEMSYGYLGLKETYKEFKDVRVRQAIEYALNRKAMVKGILNGYGKPINGPLPDVSWAYAKKGMNPYNYSPAKANKLLDEAGWTIGKDGWRIDPVTGKTADLKLTYSSGSATTQAEAVAIQQYLGDVHIHVTLNTPLDFNTLVSKVENDQVQMWLMGWSLATDPDPRGLWDSTDPYNFERWVNKHNDALIAQTWGAKAFNTKYRKNALVKWQLYVNKEMPLNFLWQQDEVWAMNKSLNIPAKDMSPNGLLNPQDWTLS